MSHINDVNILVYCGWFCV